MDFVRNALLLLLLFWTLQIAGSWIQWRHYRSAMNDATGRWTDGFLGVGQSKSRLAAGAVALLSVGPDMRVRQLHTMRGLTVFARFKPSAGAQGLTLAQLAMQHAPGAKDTAVDKAIRQAIGQVEEVARRQP